MSGAPNDREGRRLSRRSHSAGLALGLGESVVDVVGGQEAGLRMNLILFVPGEEVAAVDAGVLLTAETDGEVGPVLQGLGLRMRRALRRGDQRQLADVMNIVHTSRMTKRLQAIGNSAGIIIDRPILDLLGITQETDLELKTDGRRLIITPLESERTRRGRLAKVQARALRQHAETFRKLAK